MNIQLNSTSLQNRTKFKSNNRFKEERQNIIIKNYYSVQDDELYFTNFLSKTRNKKEINILSEFNKNHNLKYLEKNFYTDELTYSPSSSERLLGIFGLYNTRVNKITNVIKYKSRIEKGVQIYLTKNNNRLEAILIDVFHLGIPSEFYYTNSSKFKSRPKKVYSKNKENGYDISEILTDLEKNELIEKYSYKELVTE